MKLQDFRGISFLWPENMSGFCFAFVNKDPYTDYLLMYADQKAIFKNFDLDTAMTISGLTNYTDTISKVEESYSILEGYSEKDQVAYIKTLSEHGINDYVIFSFLLCRDSLSLVRQFMAFVTQEGLLSCSQLPTFKSGYKNWIISAFNKPNMQIPLGTCEAITSKTYFNNEIIDDTELPEEYLKPTSKLKTFQYQDEDNSEVMTVYIVLRSDLYRSVPEQMCDIASLMGKLSESPNYFCFKEVWDDQVVILKADYDDLFLNNYIPLTPDDPRLLFAVTSSNYNRVAHGNFRLAESQINGIAYMGRKCDMPKYIRKLQLWS